MFEVEKSLGLNFKSQLKKFQQKRFAFDFVEASSHSKRI